MSPSHIIAIGVIIECSSEGAHRFCFESHPIRSIRPRRASESHIQEIQQLAVAVQLVSRNTKAQQNQDAVVACSWIPHQNELLLAKGFELELILVHIHEGLEDTQNLLVHKGLGASDANDGANGFNVLHCLAIAISPVKLIQEVTIQR